MKRLSADPRWADSELGKTLAMIIDRETPVTVAVLCDYLTDADLVVHRRCLYRWVDSISGQPRMYIKPRLLFHERLRQFRAAFTAAIAEDALKPGPDGEALSANEVVHILRAFTPTRDDNN